MKTKMSTRLISAVLAFCLAISCAFQAFAAESYTATYTEKATKDVYSTILNDANKLIGDAALTGATIQSIYAVVPSLKPVLPDAVKSSFYNGTDAEIFAKLDEFMAANSYTEVSADVLNAYFNENPIVVKDSSDFTAKLKTIVNAVITKNVYSTVVMVIAMGCSMTPSIGDAKMAEFVGSVDNICKALGVNQEKSFYEVLFPGEGVDDEVKRESLVNYFNTIIDALLPNLSQNVVGMLQNVVADENNALLYKGTTTLFTMLSEMIKAVGPMIGMFVPGLDLAPIQQPVDGIKDMLNAFPTVGEGDAKMFDLEGAIAYLVNDVVAPKIAGSRFDVISFGEGGKGALKLDKFNLANLVNAKDETDAFNVIFNYLYNNLNKQANKEVIEPLLPLVPSLAPQVPKDVVDYLTFVLNNTKEDSAFQLYALLRIATGHSSDMSDLAPAETVEPTPVDPETPVDPQTPVDPKPQPKPETNTKPATTKPSAQSDKVKDPKLPNTGLVEDGTSMTMALAGTAALGLVLVAVAAKKRGSYNA